MKRLLGIETAGSYSFNPATKKITFSGLIYNITLQNILLITNVTANTIIYNFADPSTGAVSFANNVLTLTYNTASMNASDVLQIYLDVEAQESLEALLRRMNKLLESNAVVDSALRQRITIAGVDSSGTTTTLSGTVPVSGTVTSTLATTVSSAVNGPLTPYTYTTASAGLITEGPVSQFWRIVDDARSCYATAIRSKLSFT